MIILNISGGSRQNSRSNTPAVPDESCANVSSPSGKKEPPKGEAHEEEPGPGFNIDDFLGDIIGLPSTQEESGASKLKQFFSQRESPTGGAGASRRSSIEQHLAALAPGK